MVSLLPKYNARVLLVVVCSKGPEAGLVVRDQLAVPSILARSASSSTITFLHLDHIDHISVVTSHQVLGIECYQDSGHERDDSWERDGRHVEGHHVNDVGNDFIHLLSLVRLDSIRPHRADGGV